MQPDQGHRPPPPNGQAGGQRDGQAGGQRAGQAVAPAAGLPASGAAPANGARPRAAGPGPAAVERTVFRLPGAIVAWWAWVILAVACLVDMAVTGFDYTAAEIAVTLAVVTGVVYACALRPRVIADSRGITVQNPLRDHQIPWGTVTGVDLKESVRVHCAREPEAKHGKVVHSWALYAQRRNRLRSELVAQGGRRRLPRLPMPGEGMPAGQTGDRMPAEAQKIASQSAAQVMADQLDRLARDARERGAPAGPRVATWAWQPVAAIVGPAIVLVLVITLFR